VCACACAARSVLRGHAWPNQTPRGLTHLRVRDTHARIGKANACFPRYFPLLSSCLPFPFKDRVSLPESSFHPPTSLQTLSMPSSSPYPRALRMGNKISVRATLSLFSLPFFYLQKVDHSLSFLVASKVGHPLRGYELGFVCNGGVVIAFSAVKLVLHFLRLLLLLPLLYNGEGQRGQAQSTDNRFDGVK